jgi:putative redox protein
MYADRKKWSLDKVTVTLKHSKMHVEDSSHPEGRKSKVDVFHRMIEMEGELDEVQREKLMEIADKCPVHRTLTDTDVKIETEMVD